MSENIAETVLNALRADMPQLSDAGLRAARALLGSLRDDIRAWSAMASTGSLSADDVRWLAAARMDVVRMEALKESGLSMAHLDALRRRLMVHIVSSLFPVPGTP